MAVAAGASGIDRPLNWLHGHRSLVFPVASISLVLVILIPLPTSIMDVLLSANITLAALIMLTTIYVTHPLEFSVFPSLLLATTLLRLVLNIATTRLILTAGERFDNPEEATAAAGYVIQTFGNFVASGSLVVGFIIFIILVVIQFVVITKGATRISEVAARFTLDGMPGKQMAIDADLNAGLLNEAQARTRRDMISRESDFYGAMDGASKFVRGDAIASVVITLVNIAGGLYVGMVVYGWSMGQCVQTFTKLTIGDGLVTQIPAFIISISAGLIVTRSTAKTNLGEELIGQLLSKPVALAITAGFVAMLALTPLPKGPLLLLGGCCGGMALILLRAEKQELAREAASQLASAAPKSESVETLLTVDPMELEVGYGLIPLADRDQGGDLLERISRLRRQIALELGIIVPPIRIRDNVRLGPNQYTVKLRSADIATGQAIAGKYLAIDSGAVHQKVQGISAVEPTLALPGVWIEPDQQSIAQRNNYTVVPASSVIATHLTDIIKKHAAELLTRDQTQRLLDILKERCPAVVEEVVGPMLKVGQVQKVLQNLLRERVAIRDLQTILETLGDWAGRTEDIELLTEYVRSALARNICWQYKYENEDNKSTIRCVTMDPALEDAIHGYVQRSDAGSYLTLPPAKASKIVGAVTDQVQRDGDSQGQTVVLCSPQIRMHLRHLIESCLPSVPVLAYNEIVKGIEVESIGFVSVELT